jgi:hypothetical protein
MLRPHREEAASQRTLKEKPSGRTADAARQLYLLAYDRHRHRFDFDNLSLLGFALRAAMLT